MGTVLITGATGYIANSIKRWLDARGDKRTAELISLRDPDWEQRDFTGVDAIIHTAALVHRNEKDIPLEQYQQINRDLTCRLARKAKEQGVPHFIFFSTIAVYGVAPSCFSSTEIREDTPLSPITKYGISKREAEQALLAMASPDFCVSIIRPPFVYGKGCPGNYRSLRSLTLRFRTIPRLSNKKSILYVDNLCECVYLILDRRLPGIFCPQNERVVSTWEMAELICRYNGKKGLCSPLFNPFVKLGSRAVRKLRVAFGSQYYSLALSQKQLGTEYIVVNFEDSMKITES